MDALEYKKRELINAPIGEVWAMVAHFPNIPAWSSQVNRVVNLVPGSEHDMGAQYKYQMVTSLGIPVSVEVEVTKVEPFKYFGYTTRGEYTGLYTWHLEAQGEKTWLTYEVSMLVIHRMLGLVFTLIKPFLNRNMRKTIGTYFTDIAAFVSQPHEPITIPVHTNP